MLFRSIAASIFQAVVNQTISGLACGKVISGRVAFLGGPLYYLSELRKRFQETLKLSDDNAIFPEDAQLFVALGAALEADGKYLSFSDLFADLILLEQKTLAEVPRLEPLFKDADAIAAFKQRHSKYKVPRRPLDAYQGSAFLGIDAGSTTSKIVLLDDESNILFSHYGSNDGSPVQSVINVLCELYRQIPPAVKIVYSAVTGYGEGVHQAGFRHRRGRSRDHCALSGSGLLAPRCQFYFGYRRSRHEMHADQRRGNRQYYA